MPSRHAIIDILGSLGFKVDDHCTNYRINGKRANVFVGRPRWVAPTAPAQPAVVHGRKRATTDVNGRATGSPLPDPVTFRAFHCTM